MVYTPNSKSLGLAYQNGNLTILDLAKNTPTQQFKIYANEITFSHDGKELFTLGDKEAQLILLQQNKTVSTPLVAGSSTYTPEGKLLVQQADGNILEFGTTCPALSKVNGIAR